MEIKSHHFAKHSVMRLSGEIDLFNVEELKREFRIFQTTGIKNIGIDLLDVSYIDSSGLGVLISIMTELKKNGGKLLLFNLSESVKTVLKLTKLSAFFCIADQEEEKIAALF